jgi:predicted lipoprotein
VLSIATEVEGDMAEQRSTATAGEAVEAAEADAVQNPVEEVEEVWADK